MKYSSRELVYLGHSSLIRRTSVVKVFASVVFLNVIKLSAVAQEFENYNIFIDREVQLMTAKIR